ncbi:hypothetical protein D5S17_32705 [Pseudonocardiaceae bacterium YIM PH 21723]|nr:hypothetical protein D5S17_32705 [Pseudonocardiaceae bacterium YIM PH 21723]
MSGAYAAGATALAGLAGGGGMAWWWQPALKFRHAIPGRYRVANVGKQADALCAFQMAIQNPSDFKKSDWIAVPECPKCLAVISGLADPMHDHARPGARRTAGVDS